MKKTNPYSNLMRDYALQMNADFLFKEFLEKVEKNEIREDGTNRLISLIDKYISTNSGFKRTITTGTKLYRARVINNAELSLKNGFSVDENGITKGFDESNSREAPLGFGAAGRNNIAGVSYLYMANDPKTACAEVKPIVRQLLSLAEFKVLKPIHVVDFASDKSFDRDESINDNVSLGRLFTNIMMKYSMPISNPIEYKATQIITDHIRKTGIDGIAYRSYLNNNGVNYTFFNSSRDRFKYENSRIVMLQSERRSFIDFNNNRAVASKTRGYASYNKKDSDEMIKWISEHIIDYK